jgi:hypothetical protein
MKFEPGGFARGGHPSDSHGSWRSGRDGGRFLLRDRDPLCGLLFIPCRRDLSDRGLGQVPGPFPHSHHLRAAEIPPLDQIESSGEPRRHGGSHRADGPGGSPLPFPFQEFQTGNTGGPAGLWGSEMALAGRARLPLGFFHHRPPALPLFPRPGSRLCEPAGDPGWFI